MSLQRLDSWWRNSLIIHLGDEGVTATPTPTLTKQIDRITQVIREGISRRQSVHV